MSAQGFCRLCKAEASFMCRRCDDHYCSKECQIQDWQTHKLYCFKLPDLVPVSNIGSISSLDRLNLNAMRRPMKSLDECRRAMSDHGDHSDNGSVGSSSSLETVVQNSDETSSQVSTVIARKQNAPKAAWLMSFPPPQNDSFEVVVKHIEDRRDDGESLVWVTELRYISSLEKMINDINSAIDVPQATPSATKHVCVGNLVAVLTNNLLQRAEVLRVREAKQLAAVRLIDIGMEQHVSFSKIFMPIPSMASANAYAFCVSVKDTISAIKVGELAKIRVLGLKSVEPIEIYAAEIELKTPPLHLPVGLLQQATDVQLVKLFEGGQHALVQMTQLYLQMPNLSELIGNYKGQQLSFNHPTERGRFVSARTTNGWQRAVLLGCVEKVSRFLVYLIDKGRIGISHEIKKIPLEIAAHPAAVIAISSTDGKELPIACASALCLKSQLLEDNKAVSTLRCMLLQKNNPLQTVIATSFFSDLTQLNVKYWSECTADGKSVFITHIISHAVVFVSNSSSADYPEMFAEAASNCATFTESDKIAVGDCVLVMPEAQSKSCFRADVLAIVDGGYNVRDIDTGASLIVSRQMLRHPNQFVRACPVYVQQVKLAILGDIPNVMPNNKALDLLKEYCHSGTHFQLKYQAPQSTQPYPVVDLVYPSNINQTLSLKLLPLLFVSALKESDEIVNNKPPMASEKKLQSPLLASPAATPGLTKIITHCDEVQAAHGSAVDAQPMLSDASDAGTTVDTEKAAIQYDVENISVVKITTGDNVSLLVLDNSTIDKGYITAADMSNKEFLTKQCTEYFPKIANYCKNTTKPVDYKPSYYKLCLAIYPVDGVWYRALRIKDRDNSNDETFTVMFVDYGNICQVSHKDVLPLTSELLFPTNANVCFLKPALTIEQIEMLKDKPTLECKVTERGENEYYICIHDLN